MCVKFLENSVKQCMLLLLQVYEWKHIYTDCKFLFSELSFDNEIVSIVSADGQKQERTRHALTALAVAVAEAKAEGAACMRWRKCGMDWQSGVMGGMHVRRAGRRCIRRVAEELEKMAQRSGARGG